MDKFVMVPVEPTGEMIGAVEGASYIFGIGEEEWEGEVSEFMAEDIYRAMLAATPTPVFNEAAERAEFRAWHSERFEEDMGGSEAWLKWRNRMLRMERAWIACAKRKAGGVL